MFAIFPNPATEEINIKATGAPIQTVEISVLDISGRVLIHQQHQIVPASFNISALPSAIYQLRISSGNQEYHYKFVKQ